MNMERENALLANRACKPEDLLLLLLAYSVLQDTTLNQVYSHPVGRSPHRLTQDVNLISRSLAALIRTVDRALTNGGWQTIFTDAPGTDNLAKFAPQLPYWQYLADELGYGGPEAKLAALPQARREVARWQTLSHKYSSL